MPQAGLVSITGKIFLIVQTNIKTLDVFSLVFHRKATCCNLTCPPPINHLRKGFVTIPSPLGEGQTDTPISHACQGEVNPHADSITTLWARSITNKKHRTSSAQCFLVSRLSILLSN